MTPNSSGDRTCESCHFLVRERREPKPFTDEEVARGDVSMGNTTCFKKVWDFSAPEFRQMPIPPAYELFRSAIQVKRDEFECFYFRRSNFGLGLTAAEELERRAYQQRMEDLRAKNGLKNGVKIALVAGATAAILSPLVVKFWEWAPNLLSKL